MNETASVDCLWGKWGNAAAPTLSLKGHLLDTAAVAGMLWDTWVPAVPKRLWADAVGEPPESFAGEPGEWPRAVFMWLAGVHDVGKADPIFQGQLLSPQQNRFAGFANDLRARGFVFPGDPDLADVPRVDIQAIVRAGADSSDRPFFRHEAVTGARLESAGAPVWAAAVLSGHHGRYLCRETPSGTRRVSVDEDYQRWMLERSGRIWGDMQARLATVIEHVTGVTPTDVPALSTAVAAVPFMTGFVCLADWLASDESFVRAAPKRLLHTPDAYVAERRRQAVTFVETTMGLPHAPGGDFADMFDGRTPDDRAVQRWVVNESTVDGSNPMLTVVAVPMGEGKTEAVLYEHAKHFDVYRDGLYFALPTTATADAMWDRVRDWFTGNENTKGFLAHSRAILNTGYQHDMNRSGNPTGVCDPDGGVTPSSWFSGPHRALLAPITVGTVDQILAAAVNHKYLPVRLAALSTKHIIIDEAHTLDPYQHTLLCRLLEWLAFVGTRVTILTATLPAERFEDYRLAWIKGSHLREHGIAEDADFHHVQAAGLTYPSITRITTGTPVNQEPLPALRTYQHTVVPTLIPTGRTSVNAAVIQANLLRSQHPDARIGVVMNTVDRAIQVAQHLAASQHPVTVLHSRMMYQNRYTTTERIKTALGPGAPGHTPITVVSTQIIEASLDLDFDILITELCPMPSLLQRMGRQWRHSTPTPTPDGTTIWTHPAPLHDLRTTLEHEHDGPPVYVLTPANTDAPYRPERFAWAPYTQAELGATWDALNRGNRTTITIPDDIQTLVDAANVTWETLLTSNADEISALNAHLGEQTGKRTQAQNAGTNVAEQGLQINRLRQPSAWRRNRALHALTTGMLWNEEAVTRLTETNTLTILPYDPTGRTPGVWHGTPDTIIAYFTNRKNDPDTLRRMLNMTIPVNGKVADDLHSRHTNPEKWTKAVPSLLRTIVCVPVTTSNTATRIQGKKDTYALDPVLGLTRT